LQFEILISKTRPDLLEKMRSRPDVKFSDSNPMQASRDVLERQGLLPGGNTVLLDKITGTRNNQIPPEVIEKQSAGVSEAQMREIMGMLA